MSSQLTVFDLELKVLADLLRRAGYIVISERDAVNIEELLNQILVALSTQPVPPSAADIATAVVQALPTPPDVSAALQTLSDGIAALSTQEGTDTTAMEAALATIQATLGPAPTPTPGP